jgi:hypothetical protein
MAGVQLQVLVADLLGRSMFFQAASDTEVAGFKNLIMERFLLYSNVSALQVSH